MNACMADTIAPFCISMAVSGGVVCDPFCNVCPCCQHRRPWLPLCDRVVGFLCGLSLLVEGVVDEIKIQSV
jgi:hypothetical protein